MDSEPDFKFGYLYASHNPMQQDLFVLYKSKPTELPTIDHFYMREELKPQDVEMVVRLIAERAKRRTESTTETTEPLQSSGNSQSSDAGDSSGPTTNSEAFKHWMGH